MEHGSKWEDDVHIMYLFSVTYTGGKRSLKICNTIKQTSFMNVIPTYLPTYLPPSLLTTYQLTDPPSPWSRVFLGKLTVTQLVKKFPAFYGTQS
jgi:hypothetical protein